MRVRALVTGTLVAKFRQLPVARILERIVKPGFVPADAQPAPVIMLAVMRQLIVFIIPLVIVMVGLGLRLGMLALMELAQTVPGAS
jgi:hypothetical protein